MSQNTALEIVATSGACARRAFAAGADRIEACEALELGCISPGPEVLEDILEHRPALGVHALLRNRPGDFHYGEADLQVMERQARRLARTGVDGLVLGAVDASGTVDLKAVARMAAAGLEVNPELEITMHRAIDASTDPVASVTQLLDLGIHRVLTSGGQDCAGEGLEVIERMVQAAGGRIQIMAGGGMKARDIGPALRAGAAAVHFSAKTQHAGTIRVSEQHVEQLRNMLNALTD